MSHTLDQIVAFWNRFEELVEVRIAFIACDRKARYWDVAVIQFCQQRVVLRVVFDLIFLVLAVRGRTVVGLVVWGACRQRVVARMSSLRGQVDG